MDAGPTTRFFTKLKKVAMTLESETAKLQNTFENRNNDSDSGEWQLTGKPAVQPLNIKYKSFS